MRYDLAWTFRSFDAALAFLRDGYASGLISKDEHPRIECRPGKRSRYVVSVI